MPTCTFSETVVGITCAYCGVLFGLSESYQKRKRETHDEFKCPNGHANYYPHETEAERLRRELAQAQTNIERKEAEVRDYRTRNAHLAASRSACRGHFNRIARRIKNGVCPCCNRTFKQLAAHMHSQHPDYVPEIKENAQ